MITAGVEGADAVERGRAWHQPALPVEVVDSNGAGDAFDGGLVDALLDGADNVEAIRREATVARCRSNIAATAGCLTAPPSRTRSPTLDAVHVGGAPISARAAPRRAASGQRGDIDVAPGTGGSTMSPADDRDRRPRT